jgi:plastocyanin
MSNFFDRIRIIQREQDFLNRIVGDSGDIFTNRDTGSIRVYDGDNRGGTELARSDFANIDSSAQLDLQSKKNRIRFHWDTLTDLETEVDPVTYHGMIAHVHSEGRLYFAHAGAWIPVANLSEVEDSGSQIPYTEDTENNLQWVEGTYDFGNNIIKYANAIQLEADLDNYSPVTYHGMTMHVHETGALYYAHAGAWRKLLTDVTHNDVESAGYVNPLGAVAYSNNYSDLDNSPQSILDFGITDGTNGQILSTDGAGTFSFIDAAAGTGSAFDLIESDDGAFDPASVSNLRILGGANISTEVLTDSDELTVNLDPFSINFLTDVDTESNPPATGEVLKWDGSKWAPGTDIAEGGTGLDADTLDGQDGSYYLNYNNFTNTPSVVTLEDLSVGNELTAAGNGAISYDNTTGVFRFTPPTAAGIGATTLADFSVNVETPGVAGLIYNNTNGVFTYTPPQLGDFEFIGTTLDTVGSAQITVTPDVDFAGAVSFNTLSSTGTGTLALDSASSISLTAEDNISLAAGTGSIILDAQYWPQADGASGEVLTTDGAGQLSWQAVTSGSDQNLFQTVSTDSGSTTADTTTDTLTIAGGSDIATSVTGDTVTINFTGAGGTSQNLFQTVSADSGSTTADTSTDTLTVAGGTDISTSISGDILTVSFTGTTSSGASNFDELADVSSAGIDVNDIFEAAIVTLRVDNNGSTSYLFNSHYSGDNPTIYAISGTTIAFDLDLVGGHPFEIQDPGGAAISSGLVHVSATGSVSTGSAAQGFDSGTLYWRIQESLSGNYQYQCQFHASMNGIITVKRLSAL